MRYIGIVLHSILATRILQWRNQKKNVRKATPKLSGLFDTLCIEQRILDLQLGSAVLWTRWPFWYGNATLTRSKLGWHALTFLIYPDIMGSNDFITSKRLKREVNVKQFQKKGFSNDAGWAESHMWRASWFVSWGVSIQHCCLHDLVGSKMVQSIRQSLPFQRSKLQDSVTCPTSG